MQGFEDILNWLGNALDGWLLNAFSCRGAIECGWSLLNSNFTAALSGALAGAYIAQRIARNDTAREELLREVKSTNAAISLAASTTNMYLSFKDQIVLKWSSRYVQELQRYVQLRKDLRNGLLKAAADFHFQADLQATAPLHPAIQPLQKLVYEEISLAGMPLLKLATLALTIESLNQSIVAHHQFTQRFRKLISPEEKAAMYFGGEYKTATDETHPSLVKAIVSYTDDCIILSEEVRLALFDHGTALRKQGRNLPKVLKWDFNHARKKGLFPKDAPGS